ncbi:serine O-acetyltransferase [Mucilaginibacter frigoritolerans]|uniref:Serine acetyltransferase n=1 Tax=Mucilaginibacter frigoritolerans TaxID=652788 RepID=A0A562TS58_9SPHI|nr:serine acetyltransferase [Mucilaginibacter frigoritolerans]TWI95620.1 serine O-acetyltransferase [Mucilaginibacter frigoritolerans]
MNLFREINEDLKAGKRFSLVNKAVIFFFNRGFHALLFYRLSNLFYKYKIPVLPAILTRIVQILYGIDIDYKAKINGGIVIVHGVGLVIGSGVEIKSNVILFHGVTLGRRGVGPIISPSDGYPVIEEGCIICTGAILLGNINIGNYTTIGANCLIINNIPANSVCKLPHDNFVINNK